MPLYFAYGSNMDAAAMAVRCPRSKALGTARLMGHRMVILQQGYASVERDKRAIVHGVLYDLAMSDVAALDRYENVAQGLYTKIVQGVIRTSGGPARALVYVGLGNSGGKPRPGYFEAVLTAGKQAGLPVDYLIGMARLGGITDPSLVPPAPKSRLPGLRPPLNWGS